MKNYFKYLLFISLAAFLVIPRLSLAAASAEVQARINAIMEQIRQLQSQLAQLQAQQGGGQAWCHTFNANLRVGDRGDEAEALRIALSKEGFQVSVDDNTFNETIASSVTGFQEKYRSEILTPVRLSHGTGYVGKSTRAKLNSLYGCGVTPLPTASSVTVLSPNGGETWQKGTVQTIKWSAPVSDVSTYVDITLTDWVPPCDVKTQTCSRQPSVFYTIAKHAPSGNQSYPWKAGFDALGNDIPIGQYSVRVTDSTYGADQSDAPFSIVAAGTPAQPSVTVLSPNGGEVWQVGQTYAIKWNASGLDTVDIHLEDDSQLYPQTVLIASGVSANLGTYSWAVPSAITVGNAAFVLGGKAYKIWIDGGAFNTSKGARTYVDYSDAPFSITAATTYTAPSISALSVYSGPVGTQITLTGSGFTATGNKVKFGNLGSENNPRYSLNSTDGRTITFAVPETNYFSCWDSQPRCLVAAQLTLPGTYGVSVIDTNGTSNEVSFTVTAVQPLSITTASLPNGTVGATYLTNITATGGDTSYNWQVTSGSLPSGLALNPVLCAAITGPCQTPLGITGTPTTAGTYTFTITVTSGSLSASQQLTMTVLPAVTTPVINSIAPSSGPVGTQIVLAGSGFTATGNTANFGTGVIPNLNSSDGKNLTFQMPSYLNPSCYYSVPRCLMPAYPVQAGSYSISVANINGTSNAVNFTVSQ